MPTILLNKIRIGGKVPTNIKKGGVDVKYVKKGNTVVYDTLSYYSYGTPSLTLTYPSGNVAYSGGSKTPSTRTWTQTVTAVGHSGASYSASSLSGTISSFSVSPTSYGSINSSTGVYTFNATNTSTTRSVTVTGSVTSNGKTGTKTATLTQNGQSYYTATITWSGYDYDLQQPWGIFGNSTRPSTTLNSTDMWENSDRIILSFSPGSSLTVNANGGGTATVANGGSAWGHYWNSGVSRWYSIGGFTHDSSKSYTRTL